MKQRGTWRTSSRFRLPGFLTILYLPRLQVRKSLSRLPLSEHPSEPRS